ncbi:MAG: hypothetical protein AB7F65_03450 [Dehalococcoidia bacterium]
MNTDAPLVRRPLLVTSSVEQAEGWAGALQDAGLDALIEIGDAQYADPARSALVGILGTRPMEFVYLVTLPPAQREPAVAALLDAGWDGREGLYGGRGVMASPRTTVRSWLTALLWSAAGIAAFILIRIATG